MRSGRFDPQTQVFEFNHVPKCGGTTLHDVLGRLMDGRYVQCLPGTGWEDRIDACIGAGGHQLRGQNPIAHRPKNIVRMIVLREPLQRILSFHRHVRTNPDHYLARRRGVAAMGFADFVRYCDHARVYEFRDLQSRYVAGEDGDADDLTFVLDRFADSYDFYAPLPMLPLLRAELARFFGKPAEDVAARNVSAPVPVAAAEIRAVAPIVYRRNFNDLQLYHACCDRFMRFLATRDAATPSLSKAPAP